MSDNVRTKNLHFANARNLLKKAFLPDRTVARFTDAALDGSGQKSKAKETLRGLGEDVFELAVNPAKALVELGRGFGA